MILGFVLDFVKMLLVLMTWQRRNQDFGTHVTWIFLYIYGLAGLNFFRFLKIGWDTIFFERKENRPG